MLYWRCGGTEVLVRVGKVEFIERERERARSAGDSSTRCSVRCAIAMATGADLQQVTPFELVLRGKQPCRREIIRERERERDTDKSHTTLSRHNRKMGYEDLRE